MAVMDYSLQCVLAELFGMPTPSREAVEAAMEEERAAERAARTLATRSAILRQFPAWMRPHVLPVDATASEAGRMLSFRRQPRARWCAWCGASTWSRARRLYCSRRCGRKARLALKRVGWETPY
jgi:hypothetical protein